MIWQPCSHCPSKSIFPSKFQEPPSHAQHKTDGGGGGMQHSSRPRGLAGKVNVSFVYKELCFLCNDDLPPPPPPLPLPSHHHLRFSWSAFFADQSATTWCSSGQPRRCTMVRFQELANVLPQPTNQQTNRPTPSAFALCKLGRCLKCNLNLVLSV
jgi:hypothetical protein